jgi:hypothetical protein
VRCLAYALSFALAAAAASSPAAAEEVAAGGPMLVDRVVVRWHAAELGGAKNAQAVFERELAFEARIEALAEGKAPGSTYAARTVRAALDRHVAESLLAALPVTPVPTPREVADRAEAARAVLEERVGGRARLVEASKIEGVESAELDQMLRRQARASLYLDRMVAPMLAPTELELRELHAGGNTPYSSSPYPEVRALVARWTVSNRLSQALESYYQNARSRITILVVSGPDRRE